MKFTVNKSLYLRSCYFVKTGDYRPWIGRGSQDSFRELFSPSFV